MKDWLESYSRFCNVEALQQIRMEKNKLLELEVHQKDVEAIKNLPLAHDIETDFSGSEIAIGKRSDLNDSDFELIKQRAVDLIPWRKGPFRIFDMEIDAEWRSDKKWERLEPILSSLEGKNILDIGCNNGFFMFKMSHQNPNLVLGIDPVVPYYCQFNFVNHFARKKNLHMELFGVEDCVHFNKMFDVVFSMGIIYHHRNPIQQLLDIKKTMKAGGQLILETIGIPGNDPVSLFPEDRYAKMRNVWFIPTLSCLINFVRKARFTEIEVIADTPLTSEEQRLTDWCPPPRQSLEDFLDPDDSEKTIEGHPAPRRFIISCRKKSGDTH